MMELLCPAGSFEALKAAVCSGADAVYLGATQFSARASAANFDKETLPQAIRYAHLANVKVLVTVNTLIFPEEMEEALSLVAWLRDIGADGLIVQDLGLARNIGQRLGDAPLYASTQTTVHNLPGVTEMARQGFKRVVLARELSLTDIAHIRRHSDMELEVFAHGALCISCSGACLMSSMIGGRSGNRGRCAQPCRLPYELTVGETAVGQGTLLSPKDLMTLPFLAELASIGVDSLKIEGRLKRPEYVTITTRIYRQALEAIDQLGHYEPTPEGIDELLRIFNRGGFSRGYFYGVEDAALMNHLQSGHTGVEIGRVADARRGMVETREKLTAGDGLQFRPSGEGMAITGEDLGPGLVRLSLPQEVTDGESVFKTTDAPQLKAAQCDGLLPKRPVDMAAQLVPGQLPRLLLSADGMAVEVTGDEPVQIAQKRALTFEEVRRQLEKTDTLPWALQTLTLEGNNAFLPVSALNALRRKGLEALETAQLARTLPPWSRSPAPLKPAPAPAPRAFIPREQPALWVSCPGIEQAEAAYQEGADGVYLAVKDWQEMSDLAPLQIWRQKGRRLMAALPLWLPDASLSFIEQKLLPLRDALDGLLCPNLGTAAHFIRTGWQVITDASLNAANPAAVETLLNMGVERVTLSSELTCAQAREAALDQSESCEGIIHGRLALMHLVHCPLRALRQLPGTGEGCRSCQDQPMALHDRKGYSFPLVPTRLIRCQLTLYNTLPIVTAQAIDRLPRLGSWRLQFLDEDIPTIWRVTTVYRALIQGQSSIDKLDDFAHTTGHWFRGVE